MKSTKQINLILFLAVLSFTNVSHAGIISRITEVISKFRSGADNAAENVAKKSEHAPRKGWGDNIETPNANSGVVTENAEGAVKVRMQDFVSKVKPKSDVVGADEFSAEIARILMRKSKAAPIAVADAGTGKSANIEYLQHLIDIKSPIVGNLHDKELYFLDIYKLMGGTELRGAFEKKLASILEEMALPENANKIIVIDELENVLNNELGTKFLESMKSYLTSEMSAKLIFNITPGPYDKLMKDPQLVRRMFPVYKAAPPLSVVRNILLNIRNSAELKEGVRISNEQVEQILHLSTLHRNLKNPDVAITIMNDVINSVIADRNLGSSQIIKLRTGLENIQGEIAQILGMRKDGVAMSFGPHFDKKLMDLAEKEQTVAAVIQSYDESFRATESLRRAMNEKFEARRILVKQQNQKLEDGIFDLSNLDMRIDEINSEISDFALRVKAENPLLISLDVEEEHIINAAAHILNRNHNYVSSNINGIRREAVVERVADKLHGRHKEAVEAIVRREMAQRHLGDSSSDIPAFLIINRSKVDADRLAKAVVNEFTGADPYRIDSLEVIDETALNKHLGSNSGYAGSDREGAIYKEARMTGGHMGVLLSGIEDSTSQLRDFAERLVTTGADKNSRGEIVGMLNNQGEAVNFGKSTLFMTLSDLKPLSRGEVALINQLPTETSQQAYLREYVKNNFSGKLNRRGEGSTQISSELLDKMHVIYLNDGLVLDDQFKAIIAETLKSRVLKKSFDQYAQLSVEFTDEAVDYLFNVLRASGSMDINKVLVTEVVSFVDDLIQNKQIISGDYIQISVKGNRLEVGVTEWSNNQRARAFSASKALMSPSDKPEARKALENALKLIED